MHTDFDQCLRAVQAKDARFDGWFFTAVVTTGIYCRPSCPAVPPKPKNIRFHATAASAQAAGFRACKRCRPDASPGSPEWDVRSDLVARAMRLIADGVVDREGVPGLASRLGYSRRQLERVITDELGAGPLGIARAQRAQTARLLIETTQLPLSDVALAAGFGSVRQFNETVQAVFATTPGDLRARAKAQQPQAKGSINLRLPFRQPLFPDNLFGHLVATAVPGVEEWRDGAYRRTLRLPHGHGVVALRPTPDHVQCGLRLEDLRDLTVAISRCRRLLDLDADPVAVDALLSEDELLEPLIRKAPGRRVPRTVDEHELAIRAVLGQQVSTAAARTHAGRLVGALGDPVDDDTLTHLFPTAEAIADVDPASLAMPRVPQAHPHRPGDRARRRRRRSRARRRPRPGPRAARSGQGRRSVDRRDDRDAGARRSGRLPADRPRGHRPGEDPRPGHQVRPRDPRRALAPLAGLRRTAPVGAGAPRRQPAPGRSRMKHAILDSPIGPLTLVADGNAVAGLYMAEHRHRPAIDGPRDDTVLPDVREQLKAYFDRDLKEFAVTLTSQGSPFQQEVWASPDDHPVRRDLELRPAGRRHRPARGQPARSGWPTAATRSR